MSLRKSIWLPLKCSMKEAERLKRESVLPTTNCPKMCLICMKTLARISVIRVGETSIFPIAGGALNALGLPGMPSSRPFIGQVNGITFNHETKKIT